MIYGSVCSGIEAATVAWHGLNATMCMTCESLGTYMGHACGECGGRGYTGGWQAAWYSEIEPFPSKVLKHHYPDTPNLGDMTKLHDRKEFNERPIELLVGGTPCQSFSVAGLRKGLADPRGNLALHFLKIVDTARPRWVVWENVPGVISSWDTTEGVERNALDQFTAGLGELGYGVAWRTLDARYFGVPQRRRRVFVVGYLGDWRPAAAVLFERHSLSGDPAPSRKKREGIAGGFEVGPSGGSLTDTSPTLDTRAKDGPRRNQLGIGVFHPTGHAKYKEGPGVLRSSGGDCGLGSETIVTHALTKRYDSSEDGSGRGVPLVMAHGQGNAEIVRDGSPSLTCNHEAPILAIHPRAIGRDAGGPEGKDWRDDGHSFTLDSGEPGAVIFEARVARNGRGAPEEVCPPLKAENGETGKGDGAPLLQVGMSVRRLTPKECERLQGFPDDYTNIPGAKDGPRYKALGNSMAVPVMAWIGRRIQVVENILKESSHA